ncbi:MAG TPA: ribokinase [Streptosporangiaceae bacterium]
MGARVAVVGSVNADYILAVSTLPRPGETVTGGRLSVRPGGKGANQAHAAARLGADVILVAAVGPDEAGRAERASLAADHIDPGGLAECDAPTGAAVVLVDAAGENAIAVAPGANDLLSAELVRQRLDGWLDRASVLLCSLEVPLEPVTAAAQAATAVGAHVIVNPAPAQPLPAALLRDAVLTPNEGEIRRLVPDADDEAAAVAHLLGAGARAVVITKGGRGAVLHDAGQAPLEVAAPRVEVVDTVGAGDAFNGALAWSLGHGAPLRSAVAAAVAAGAAACTGPGARDALPDPAALAALLGPAAFTAAGGG